MVSIATSKNGIPIRLTEERWQHIITDHPELIDQQMAVFEAITNPGRILEGSSGELLAIQETQPGKWLVVAYRELAADGFIITAFFTSRFRYLERRRQLWP